MHEIIATQWLNTKQALSLEQLKGKVVAVHAFQMLCPGCVSHGLPQAGLIHDIFPDEHVQVIGLHSVFEHHEAMTETALKAFVHEYKISFPIAIDEPAISGVVPQTMQAWQLQGTPSLLLFDKKGELRLKHFGRLGDMQVGAVIANLVAEQVDETLPTNKHIKKIPTQESCDDDGCAYTF